MKLKLKQRKKYDHSANNYYANVCNCSDQVPVKLSCGCVMCGNLILSLSCCIAAEHVLLTIHALPHSTISGYELDVGIVCNYGLWSVDYFAQSSFVQVKHTDGNLPKTKAHSLWQVKAAALQ